MNVCGKVLKNLPGVFIDPNYKYSIRAYRFISNRTKGLDVKEAEKILKVFELDKLRFITRQNDKYFVGKKMKKKNPT